MSAVQMALSAGVAPDRVTDDLVERKLYSRDLAAVPAILTRPFFRTMPDAVVRPRSAEEVAGVMRHASRWRIPVTPRAAATTSNYGCVPVRGGLVLDLNDLGGVIDLNAARQTVRVLPATTWCELDDALRLRGFAVKSYPSSAVSATVGGWVSTQGLGIGSLRHGALGEQLYGLQVALPDGQLRTLGHDTDPPLDWFVAAEGTLGVVTEIELAIQRKPPAESYHLLAFDDLDSLGQSILSLARSEPRPFTVSFADGGYLELLARAGFDTPAGPAAPALHVHEGRDESASIPTGEVGQGAGVETAILLVCFQGEAAEVSRGRDTLGSLPGRELPSELALDEWGLRCYHLRCKRAGPSLLAAEQTVPLGRLCNYLRAVGAAARRNRLAIGTYGVAVAPDRALVMSVYPADERRPLEYLAATGFSKRLYDLGARHGGRPYGVGLWNSAYLPRLFGSAQLAQMRCRKALLDPLDIMNPGKLYRSPFPLWPALFGPAAELLAAAFVALRRWR